MTGTLPEFLHIFREDASQPLFFEITTYLTIQEIW